MSTRSTIGIIRGFNENAARIYCHSDGYLSWNGAILQKYYNTAEKVEKLLALGNLSCLGPEIKPDDPADWDIHKTLDSRFCKTYTSRGEEWEQIDPAQREEYNYTFHVVDGCWTVEYTVGKEPGETGQRLGFDKLYTTKELYLIDALADLSVETWEDMAPRDENDWGVSLAECIAAAREAREPINEQKRRDYEAYYRAYCD